MLSCLEAILSKRSSNSTINLFVKKWVLESRKVNLSPSGAFVLVDWGALLTANAAQETAIWEQHGSSLVAGLAGILELCVASTHREGLRRSAFAAVKQGCHQIIAHDSSRAAFLRTTIDNLTSKSSSLGPKASSFLGVVAEAWAHTAKEALEPEKPALLSFYNREIIGSRNPLPHHILGGLGPFILKYVTSDDFDTHIAPSLEKALLRSPEVVLNDAIPILVSSLSPDLDVTRSLAERLIQPLLTCGKSQNPGIRAGAISAFSALVKLSRDEDSLAKVTDTLINPLSSAKLSAAEHRHAYASMLSNIPYVGSRCQILCDKLAQVAQKESNESALDAEVLTLSQQVGLLLGNQNINVNGNLTSTAKAFEKGLSEKRSGILRVWANHFGNIFVRSESQGKGSSILVQVFSSCIDKLLDLFNEANHTSPNVLSPGISVAGFVTIYCQKHFLDHSMDEALKVRIRKTAIMEHVLSTDSKPSFVLNHRLYTRLNDSIEISWLLRSLQSCLYHLADTEAMQSATALWCFAFFYCATSTSLQPSDRRQALGTLRASYSTRPSLISTLVIRALWKWIRSIYRGTADTPATATKSGNRWLSQIVRAIFPDPSNHIQNAMNGTANDILSDQLINVLVLAQPSIIPNLEWIKLCQKVGKDPGALVESDPDQCLSRVNSALDDTELGEPFAAAAYATAAELAFVSPATITSPLTDIIQENLPGKDVKRFGPLEIAIANAPDDEMYVDILNQTASIVLDKNSGDYETMKWEQELRSQVAKKKGQQKKLTTDERTKVEAQIKKEKAIRVEVGALRRKLRKGLGLVSALAHIPAEAIDHRIWFGPSLISLLSVIDTGGSYIVGDTVFNAYLSLSTLVTPRVASLRMFIGVATLRIMGAAGLASNLVEEPLNRLVTRLLYRFRLLGEQKPFDPITLLYVTPLVSQVLRKGGVGQVEEEEKEEQVTLALEFLSFHAESMSDPMLPREDILMLLRECIETHANHYKLIRDILYEYCRALSAEVGTKELTVILRATVAPRADVRLAFLHAVRDHLDLTELDFVEEIWLASHDDDEENRAIGEAIWHDNALDMEPSDIPKLFPYLSNVASQVRRAAARSLGAGIQIHTSEFSASMAFLMNQYQELAKPRVPERDKLGMIKKTSLADPWEARSGIAMGFKEMAQSFASDDLGSFMQFLIQSRAIGDTNKVVRDQMRQAAIDVISLKGGERVEALMDLFETTLSSTDTNSATSDAVNEAVVVLYGALAQHLQTGDQRVPKIVRRLLETLETPSEDIQYAVAQCLPPLVRTSSPQASGYLQIVTDRLLHAKHYASRRGAAYGLAGIVSGKGLSILREHRLLSTLKVAIEDKKAQNGRQGAFIAYELLSTMLGRMYEPFVIQIVPQLLLGLGDASADVREACLDASKASFANLSSYGVKLILPTLLEGLDESQWRSKKGACDLLGAMAYLDPQQLALSLPEIIPPLTNVLNDSHKEVRASANRSLQHFGEVISNPEVKSLVSILLKALSDPTKFTDDALDALIKVSFVHYLDAPSLALIVRILERGLGDRSATKRKSSQIIGSLAHLTERKDVTHHLPILVSGLKAAVVDPVPATRATASKALGSLVEKLGEEALPDLIPNLMATLRSDTGAGDRLGSAQALSEVLAGLGTSRLEETLPTILQNVSSSRSTTREGFMSLFIYLPACFGNSFAVYLNKIIPPILAGLADDVESIRETSLRAGRLLVKNFATKAIDLLLPELDRGLGDDSHRIRLSSVELVGDLLFNLTGISAQVEQDEEDTTAAEAGTSLLEVLGQDKRDKILSSLYICRCDTSGLVRTAAIGVWKALVSTPRTLKEIIPTLTPLLIRRLASSNPEQKVIAATALGELIRKAGDGVLASLLPTLEEGLSTSTDIDHRQGICIALREIISSASEDTLLDYERVLISVVRVALVDSNLEVREAAAEAFDSLQKTFGKRAVDQVLPYLLNLLRSDDEASTALAALLTLLTDSTRSNIILPNLIPTFLEAPISPFNARALASLAQVAGPALNRRLPVILNTLIENEVANPDTAVATELKSSFDVILVSVDEFDGLNTSMSVMLALVKHSDHRLRAAASRHLGTFVAKTSIDFSRYHPDLTRVLLISFDDPDQDVVKAAWEALSELTKRLKKEELEVLVPSTRQVLQQVGVPGANLAGFEIPKGIGAILPIFLQGLMNGTAEQRTQAALAISDIIDRTSADALKLFVTQITGPLIRVISERSVDVKCKLFSFDDFAFKADNFQVLSSSRSTTCSRRSQLL